MVSLPELKVSVGFGWQDAPGRLWQARVIDPISLFEGRVLDGFEGSQRTVAVDGVGLPKAD